jgi:CelD/BcsL family acetyltransferase involved in cellulose biosynthesis
MAAARQSLRRHERYFRRSGRLSVEHLRDAEAILTELPKFMAQHRDRWAHTSSPSLFCDPQQQRFYQQLAGCEESWLRFTRIVWEDRPIAYHFGFSHAGTFLWYKPSFDISLARHSPGEVLLRQLFLESLAQGEHTFDFGLGDEPFKHRFASHVRHVRTWGLYPPKQVRCAALAQEALT